MGVVHGKRPNKLQSGDMRRDVDINHIQRQPKALLPAYTGAPIKDGGVSEVARELRAASNHKKYIEDENYLIDLEFHDNATVLVTIIDCCRSYSAQIQISIILVNPRVHMLCTRSIRGNKELNVEIFNHLCKKMNHLLEFEDESDSEDFSDSEDEDEHSLFIENGELEDGEMYLYLDQGIANLCRLSRIKVERSMLIVEVSQIIENLCCSSRFAIEILGSSNKSIENTYKQLTQNYVFHIRYDDEALKSHVINKRRKKAIELYKPEPTSNSATILFAPRNHFVPKTSTINMRAMEIGSGASQHVSLKDLTIRQPQYRNFTSISNYSAPERWANEQNATIKPATDNRKCNDWQGSHAYELQNIELALTQRSFSDNYQNSLCKIISHCRNKKNANAAFTCLGESFTKDVLIGQLIEVGTKWETTLANRIYNITLLIVAAETMILNSEQYQRYLVEQERSVLEQLVCVLIVVYFKSLDAKQLISPETKQPLLQQNEDMDFDIAFYDPHLKTSSGLVVQAIQRILEALLEVDASTEENVFTECVDDLLTTLSSQGLPDEVHDFMQYVVEQFNYGGFLDCFQ